MLKKILALALLALPFASEAKIIETKHFGDVLPYIDQDTWFLIDLDNTLYQAAQALGHADWVYDEVMQRVEKGMSRRDAFHEFHPTWIKMQEICPVKAMEEDFIPAIRNLQNKGIAIMGLTHRPVAVAASTVKQINSLGLDLTTTAPWSENFVVPAKDPTLYTQGVLFVSDFNDKGAVLATFLSCIQKSPKKIVFMDDKKHNVDDLETTCAALGIEYVGVHYTAIVHNERVYSHKLAQFQHKFVPRIISNEEALQLLKNEH